ncbi:cardiolipin synthase [Mycoplasma marinum]|uniref:cardiolipin synthase n=1 Tax=Mycoplasma marinum TaxID=1937190 RepID=UPI003B34AE91
MKIVQRIFTLIFTLLAMAGIVYLFYTLYLFGVHWALVTFMAIYSVTAIWAIMVFGQVRHTAAKTSWLLMMILLPIIGLFIYLIFGRRFKGRKSLEEFHEEYKETYLIQEKSVKTDNVIMNKQTKFSKTPILNADLKIYDNGMYAFKHMYDDLNKAKKFIHLNYYIIKSGEVWEELKEIFIRKISEGVEVRLIVDDFGRWALPWYEMIDLKKKGLKISIYDQVRFPFISSQNGCRSHRKYMSIDGKIGYTGGINLTDEYVNYSKNYGIWEDLVMRVEGQAVRSFSLQFINDWKLINKKVLDVEKYAPKIKSDFKNNAIHIEDSPEIRVPIMQDSLVHWISKAKKSIKLSTPYFIPTEEIMGALRHASLSGVEVKLYLPGAPDKKSAYEASKANARILEEYGVKVYIVKEKFIHTKAGIFDDKTAYLGTMNIDMRSFFSQFENLMLFEGEEVKKLIEVFKRYEKQSELLKAKPWQDMNIFQKAKTTLLRIVFPMM